MMLMMMMMLMKMFHVHDVLRTARTRAARCRLGRSRASMRDALGNGGKMAHPLQSRLPLRCSSRIPLGRASSMTTLFETFFARLKKESFVGWI
jgi:hypothetical protein